LELLLEKQLARVWLNGWAFGQVEGNSLRGEDEEMMENSDGKNTVTDEASSVVEPFICMEFDSDVAVKTFYDGFVMRVDAFRR
ncbi:unnamed protein product, partial [Thlaspi arvense]